MKHWTRKEKFGIPLLLALILLGIWFLIVEMDVRSIVAFGFVALAMLGAALLRLWLGYVIGNAARKRQFGYRGWIISSFIIGPLLVWVFYLIFVHWRPVIDDAIPIISKQD